MRSQAWKLSDQHREDAIRALRVTGYVIFENVLDAPRVQELHGAFMEIFERYVAEIGDNRGKQRQGGVPLPIEGTFADPDLIGNPLVIDLIEQLLGPDLVCSYFASDTPMPGSEYQPVHRDGKDLFPGVPVTVPPYMYELNVPLVDFREDNGPIEVWPRTHLVSDFPLLEQQRDELRVGNGQLTITTDTGRPGLHPRVRVPRHRRAAVRRRPARAAGSHAGRVVPCSRSADVASRHPEPFRGGPADAVAGLRALLVPVQRGHPPARRL